jgi:hypothetical protein
MSGYAWPLRRSRVDLKRASFELGLGALAAALIGLLVSRDPFYGFLLPGLLVAIWLSVSPYAAAIALGLSIPAVETVANGHLGLNISVEDLLLVALSLSVVGAGVMARNAETFRALRPLAFPVGQYCLYVLILLLAHPGFAALVQTVQRYELLAFPILVGAYLGIRGCALPLLKAYVLASTALAIAWPLFDTGFQKNPTGQFIADALLVVLAVPRLWRYQICVPLLVYGLFATESRGAILACALGVLVVVLMQWTHSPARALARTAAILVTVGLMFALMPAGVQSRVTTFGSSGDSKAAWTIRFRQQFTHDALVLTRQHALLGVGVGSYDAATMQANLQPTTDPHDVFLLQTAEGGWGFGVSFVVLVLGTVAALVRLRRVELAPAAIAVLLATVTHGMFDVYWVRGTPVLGWLLAAIVCGTAARSRAAAA